MKRLLVKLEVLSLKTGNVFLVLFVTQPNLEYHYALRQLTLNVHLVPLVYQQNIRQLHAEKVVY
jgi:hypothetical protein